MSNARKVAGGGGVGVEGESGLGIESVKIKRYGLTMDSKIIQNLKLVSLAICSKGNYSFWG